MLVKDFRVVSTPAIPGHDAQSASHECPAPKPPKAPTTTRPSGSPNTGCAFVCFDAFNPYDTTNQTHTQVCLPIGNC